MIPVRYAKALFEFATEKGCDGRVYGQMGKLAAAFVREPELRRVLDNPVLPESEKLKLVYALAEAIRARCSSVSRNWCCITVESVSCNGSR